MFNAEARIPQAKPVREADALAGVQICIASRGQSEKIVLEVKLSKMVVARANARASFSST